MVWSENAEPSSSASLFQNLLEAKRVRKVSISSGNQLQLDAHSGSWTVENVSGRDYKKEVKIRGPDQGVGPIPALDMHGSGFLIKDY